MVLNLGSLFFTAATGYAVYLFSHDLNLNFWAERGGITRARDPINSGYQNLQSRDMSSGGGRGDNWALLVYSMQ